MGPNRRRFLEATVIGGVAAATGAVVPVASSAETVRSGYDVSSSELDEITVSDLQDAMSSGKFSSRSITEKYLERIEKVDKQGPTVNSVIEVNPDAIAIADALDKERKDKAPRGPLHGIPVLIKDNIDTADRMATTAGSLALVGSKDPPSA